MNFITESAEDVTSWLDGGCMILDTVATRTFTMLLPDFQCVYFVWVEKIPTRNE